MLDNLLRGYFIINFFIFLLLILGFNILCYIVLVVGFLFSLFFERNEEIRLMCVYFKK